MNIAEGIGWVTIVVVGLFAVGGLALGLRSIPDARRYLKIRRM
ncbi:MAG: hypothetical protein ABI307_06825 [Mycobacterium sp.]